MSWLAPGAAGDRPHTPAGADRVVDRGRERDAIDWTRGLIIAVGASAADLRAPSPAVARVAALRKAREQAKARLMAQASTIMLHGQTLAEHMGHRAQIKKRLEHAVDQAVELDVEHASDGSVVMTAGLPLEAVRLAVRPDDAKPPAAIRKNTATTILVDARGVLAHPALGIEIITSKGPMAGPTVFHAQPKAARADARLGDRVIEARAKKLVHEQGRPGLQLELQGKARASPDDVARALETGALILIVIGKKT